MISIKQMARSKHLLSSEYASYQKNNPLTQYVERVCGINTKPDADTKRVRKLSKKKYLGK
jgi:hypothetical protein